MSARPADVLGCSLGTEYPVDTTNAIVPAASGHCLTNFTHYIKEFLEKKFPLNFYLPGMDSVCLVLLGLAWFSVVLMRSVMVLKLT